MPRDEGFQAARKAKILRPSALKKIAKMQLTDVKQINTVMESIADSVGEFLGYLAYEEAYRILETELYGKMESEYYNRTRDLLSALNVRKDSNGYYNVGVDARRLRVTPRGNEGEMGFSSFGEHANFDDDSEAANIWTYINKGVVNTKFPQLSYEGIDIIGKVEVYINSVAPSEVKKFLINNGIKIK